jgi:hypothetical protein
MVKHQFDEIFWRRPASGGAGRRTSDAHVAPTQPGSQSQAPAVQDPSRPQSSSETQADESERDARESAASRSDADAGTRDVFQHIDRSEKDGIVKYGNQERGGFEKRFQRLVNLVTLVQTG